MMSELPQNSDLSTYIMAESNWISSLMNCSTIEKYFQCKHSYPKVLKYFLLTDLANVHRAFKYWRQLSISVPK